MKTHPIAVYGTLMLGYGNSGLWEPYGISIPCIIPGIRLVTTNGYFPYAILEDNEIATGELLYIRGEHYQQVLHRLDRLEGVPSHYRRIITEVETPTREGTIKQEAFLYVPNFDVEQEYGRHAVRVPGNDWASFIEAEHTL